MRHSFASRLLYFGIDLFWCVPPWPNPQQIGPHAPPYFVPSVDAVTPSTTHAILIARNHDSRTCAFAFGEFTSGSHADFQLLGFSADNWAIEVRLVQSILDAAPSRTTAIARLQINAGAARLWRGACLHKGRSFYNSRAERQQDRKRFPSPRPVHARLSSSARRNPHRAHSAASDPWR